MPRIKSLVMIAASAIIGASAVTLVSPARAEAKSARQSGCPNIWCNLDPNNLSCVFQMHWQCSFPNEDTCNASHCGGS